MSHETTFELATARIYNELRTPLGRLEENLGFVLPSQEIDRSTREALSALSYVHQQAQERIHRSKEKISNFEETKERVEGAFYAKALEWLGVGVAFFALPAIAGAPSLVGGFLVMGFLLIVVGGFLEFYTKELKRDKINKEIIAIKTEVESLCQKICEEEDEILGKLAEQIRSKKNKVIRDDLKRKIQIYVTAYKEVEVEKIAAKFEIDIEEAKVVVRELLEEHKLKGVLKDDEKFLLIEN